MSSSTLSRKSAARLVVLALGFLVCSSAAPAWAQVEARRGKDPAAAAVPVPILEQFLSRKDVIGELGLIDEQIATLSQKIRVAQDEMARLTRFPVGAVPRDLDKIQEKVAKINLQAQNEVESELLPHQRKRMRQLSLQMKYPGGNLRVYTSSEFVSELEYTPDQEAAIKAQLETTEREVHLAVERVLAEGRARIQRILTEEQRAKSADMIGPPFTFTRETPEEVRARIRRR